MNKEINAQVKAQHHLDQIKSSKKTPIFPTVNTCDKCLPSYLIYIAQN